VDNELHVYYLSVNYKIRAEDCINIFQMHYLHVLHLVDLVFIVDMRVYPKVSILS
jgi:hypothetical protein